VTRFTLIAPVVMALAVGQQAGRDRAAVPATAPTGTARITGVVVDADPDATPIRRAILTLTGAELPRGRSVISDDQGRFTFEQLPAGRFTLTSAKAAYIAGAYGATRPGRPGVPLQIAAGQVLTNVRLTMARGAVITGALRNDNGEPAADIQVAAYRVPPPGTAPNLAITAVAMTDDRGVYRFYGLIPGTYVVSSTRPLGSRLSDVVALSSTDVDRALRELQQRTGLSIAGAPAPSPPAADPMPPGDYAAAPIFYPGVAAPAAATPLVLAAGEERSGIDFAVPFIRIVKIEGSVVHPPGPPPTVQFAIRTDGLRLTSLMANVPVFSTKVEPPGRTFTYTNVGPGRYVISVRTRSGDPLYARAEVDVTGSDVIGLSLQLQPTITLRGRLVFDGKSAAPDVSTVSVQLTAANGAGGGGAGTTQLGNLNVPPGIATADGSFEIPHIIPDVYRLTTSVAESSGWWLRSATVNGRDVLDEGLEIAPGGDVSGAVLTFSDRQTMLSGTLLTAKDQIAPNLFIAVFPANRALWRPDSRRVRSARSGTDGRWIVRGLPPGEYLVAALTDLDPDELRDAAFLETLLAASVKVTLGDGEQKVQDLRIGG